MSRIELLIKSAGENKVDFFMSIPHEHLSEIKIDDLKSLYSVSDYNAKNDIVLLGFVTGVRLGDVAFLKSLKRECRKTLIFLDKTQAFCFWIKITVIPGIFLSVLFVF